MKVFIDIFGIFRKQIYLKCKNVKFRSGYYATASFHIENYSLELLSKATKC